MSASIFHSILGHLIYLNAVRISTDHNGTGPP
jgi:hypothetical protein